MTGANKQHTQEHSTTEIMTAEGGRRGLHCYVIQQSAVVGICWARQTTLHTAAEHAPTPLPRSWQADRESMMQSRRSEDGGVWAEMYGSVWRPTIALIFEQIFHICFYCGNLEYWCLLFCGHSTALTPSHAPNADNASCPRRPRADPGRTEREW